jgi:hypothetical protein
VPQADAFEQAFGSLRGAKGAVEEARQLDAGGTGVDDTGAAGAVSAEPPAEVEPPAKANPLQQAVAKNKAVIEASKAKLRPAAEPEPPALSSRVEPPESGGEKLDPAVPQAESVPRTGAQLVDTLRVNREAADLLREAYSFAGGTRIGSFDGAAVKSPDVRLLLKGLDGMAEEGHPAAGAIAAELRKTSAKGLRGVAIAGPEAVAHEQLHFAIDRLKFDPEEILQHGPTRVAAMEARSRGLASGSDARVIREVMTRIFGAEHGSLKVDDATADAIAAHFLEHATPETGAFDTLKELAHERFADTIGRTEGRTADAGTAPGGGEESGSPPDRRARQGSARGDSGTTPDSRGEAGEGPELSRPAAGNLDLFGSEDDNAEAERFAAERLTGARLTAQLKSGGQVKPSNLKPAENRGLFEEEKPESGNLFGPERGSLSLKSTRTPEQVKAAADKRYGENMREWFTARRDLWSARIRQQMDLLRKELPETVDREGLYIMRDMRNPSGRAGAVSRRHARDLWGSPAD